MILNNGNDIDVISQINIDNKPNLVCKLKNATYVNGILVRFIILPQSEFKDYTDQIARESAEIVVVETKLTPTEILCYGELVH